MTDIAMLPELANAAAASRSYPPVKPPWLRYAATAAVVLTHVGVAGFLMHTAIQQMSPLESLSMDLVQEGDIIEMEEQTEADDTPPPEVVETPDYALPPPMVMAPDPVILPANKEQQEKAKQRVEEQREVQRAKEKHQAQAKRRFGVAEGRGHASTMSKRSYFATLAAVVNGRLARMQSPGPGTVTYRFSISAGGGVSGVSASGSSPHAGMVAAVLRSMHLPAPPGGSAWVAPTTVRFH